MSTLAKVAIQIASHGFREYLAKHDTAQVCDPYSDAGFEFVKAEIKAALPQALADAKEALDANMASAAEQTFTASLTIAGIEAAKKYLASKQAQPVKQDGAVLAATWVDEL